MNARVARFLPVVQHTFLLVHRHLCTVAGQVAVLDDKHLVAALEFADNAQREVFPSQSGVYTTGVGGFGAAALHFGGCIIVVGQFAVGGAPYGLTVHGVHANIVFQPEGEHSLTHDVLQTAVLRVVHHLVASQFQNLRLVVRDVESCIPVPVALVDDVGVELELDTVVAHRTDVGHGRVETGG